MRTGMATADRVAGTLRSTEGVDPRTGIETVTTTTDVATETETETLTTGDRIEGTVLEETGIATETIAIGTIVTGTGTGTEIAIGTVIVTAAAS